MPRKREPEGLPESGSPIDGTPVEHTEALPVAVAEPVVNGAPTETGSSLPVAPKTDPPGDKPWVKFGPYPTSERRTYLTVAIWRREVTVEGGEVVEVFSVALTRTFYDKEGQPRSSGTLRSIELPLAILLLEKADRYIRELKGGDSPNGV